MQPTFHHCCWPLPHVDALFTELWIWHTALDGPSKEAVLTCSYRLLQALMLNTPIGVFFTSSGPDTFWVHTCHCWAMSTLFLLHSGSASPDDHPSALIFSFHLNPKSISPPPLHAICILFSLLHANLDSYYFPQPCWYRHCTWPT